VLAKYKRDYETLFKEDVSTFGGHAYDAFMVAIEGLKKAGEPDRAKVRDAIENLKGFVGTAGVFNFSPADHTGLGLEAFEMLTVKDGKFTSYKP
jgi:branched-chain amino acid transport system substrate-binding protein